MLIFRPTNKPIGIKYSAESKWWDNTKRYPKYANTINKKTLCDIFRYIHYNAWHAPFKKQLKWRSIEKKFLAKHDPSKAPYRWAIKYTLSKYL